MNELDYEWPQDTLEDLKYLTFPHARYGASIYEFEIYMKFRNDSDGHNFYRWWEAEGKQAFITSLTNAAEEE